MTEKLVKMGLNLMIPDEKTFTRRGDECSLGIMKGSRREDSRFAQ